MDYRREKMEMGDVELEVPGSAAGPWDVVVSSNPPEYVRREAPPPSYDSVFGKVRKAKEDSSGSVDFLWRVVTLIFCGTICCGLWIAFTLALPITSIVIGSMYLKDCPRERFIPIYLIVAGCFWLVKSFVRLGEQIRKARSKDEDEDEDEALGEATKNRRNHLDGIVSCFLLAWFIAGSVWVFRTYDDYQHEFPEQDDYCHQTLYLFAFWLLIVHYISLALTTLCCCAICIVATCVSS